MSTPTGDCSEAEGTLLGDAPCYPFRVLNLYAGLGGNRLKWENCEVTAVEMEGDIAEVYQRHNPADKVVIGDAHQYLAENFANFDFVWTSPPCQSHSKMSVSGQNRTPRYPDMKLYEEIIFLRQHFKGKWVVENVKPYYEPLIPGRSIGRHLFWSNFHWSECVEPKMPFNMMSEGNLETKKKLMDWLGIHYDETIYYKNNHCHSQVLRNCVHPDVGNHIFSSARGVESPTEIQPEFFFG